MAVTLMDTLEGDPTVLTHNDSSPLVNLPAEILENICAHLPSRGDEDRYLYTPYVYRLRRTCRALC